MSRSVLTLCKDTAFNVALKGAYPRFLTLISLAPRRASRYESQAKQEGIMPKISKTDAEWQADLSDLAYKVTRKHATERPYSHDDFPSEAGRFSCVCCGAELFDQTEKFDAGCGWPSFTAPITAENVGESEDNSLFMRRTEVHCASCAAHLGHVFPDGPAANGLRYCINGVALDFTAKDAAKDTGKD